MTRRLHIKVASLMTALLLAVPTAAQRIPERLDARDLDRYARILDLSPEQRNAAYEFYRAYVDEYDALIAAFNEPVLTEDTIPQTWVAMKDHMEAFLQRRRGLRDRIRELEDALLARIEPLLTEPQLRAMQRVRDDRFRATAMVQAFFNDVNGPARSTIPDLSVLMRQIEPTDDEWQRIDPLLGGYESQLTVLIRQLEPRALRFYWLDVGEEMIRRGHGELAIDDGADIWRVVSSDVWESNGRRAIELARRIEVLNHRTAAQIRDALDEDHRDDWMAIYYHDAFGPHSRPVYALRSIRTCLAAIERCNYTDEERALVEPLVLEYERRVRASMARWVDAATTALVPNHRFAASNSYAAFHKSAVNQEDGHNEINAWLKGQIELALGPGSWPTFYTAWKNLPDESENPSQGFGRSVQLWEEPTPITEREFEHWLSLLDVTDEQRAAADEAYADYAFRAKSISVREGDPPIRGFTEQEFEFMAPLDEQLFSLLASCVETADQKIVLDAMQRSRLRVLLSDRTTGSVAGTVDPLLLLLHSGIDGPTIATSLRDAAIDHDRLDALIEEARRDALADLQWRRRQANGELTEEQRQEWGRFAMARQQKMGQRGAIHTEHVARIRDALPAEVGAALWDRFMTLAFAPLVNDSERMHNRLAEAMKREDLPPDQRQRLEELVLEYSGAYEDLTTQMFELAKRTANWMNHHLDEMTVPTNGGWDTPDAYRLLKLERDDLNEFARLQLDLILNPEQVDN